MLRGLFHVQGQNFINQKPAFPGRRSAAACRVCTTWHHHTRKACEGQRWQLKGLWLCLLQQRRGGSLRYQRYERPDADGQENVSSQIRNLVHVRVQSFLPVRYQNTSCECSCCRTTYQQVDAEHNLSGGQKDAYHTVKSLPYVMQDCDAGSEP